MAVSRHSCAHLLATISGTSNPFTDCLQNSKSTSAVAQHGASWKNGIRAVEPDDTLYQPYQALDKWLNYRLDPNQGRIHSFLEQECRLQADRQAFSSEGQFFPNPYAFAREAALWGKLEMKLLTGNLHGDVHGNNVFSEFSLRKIIAITSLTLPCTTMILFYFTTMLILN